MCTANWSYKIDCCHDCATKCHLAFMNGGVMSQHEMLSVNSGGAASMEEMYEAHVNVNETFRGYP